MDGPGCQRPSVYFGDVRSVSISKKIPKTFTRPTTSTRAIKSNDHCFTHPKRKRTHQHTIVNMLCKQCCCGKQGQTYYKCSDGHRHCSNACMDRHGCVKLNETKVKLVSSEIMLLTLCLSLAYSTIFFFPVILFSFSNRSCRTPRTMP